MKLLLQALNRPADAFRGNRRAVSWTLVLLMIAVNAVIEPLLQYFWGAGSREINPLQMLYVAGLGVLSYLAICLVLWGVCKIFGSKIPLAGHINAWGNTFFPTLVCAVVVAVTEVFFYVFWNNTVWGMIFGFIFVGVLLWKAILYMIYLREFAGLQGVSFFGAFTVIGVVILILAWLNMFAGCKTPVL